MIKRKRFITIISFTASGILAMLYLISYKEINNEWKDPKVLSYQSGEKVKFGKDILMDYTMDGYSIRIDEAEILEYTDYVNKYQADDVYPNAPEQVYDVTLTLFNDGAAEDVGINLYDFYIEGTGVCFSVNPELLNLSNPKLHGSYAIALRPDTEYQIHLPYNLLKDHFRPEIWNNLNDFCMYFVATLYPVKKTILL